MRSAVWWSLSVLLAAALAAAVALLPISGSAPKTDHVADDPAHPLGPAYVGDAVCAQCHADQAQLQQESGHSHTLLSEGLTERFAAILNRDFPDPERGGVFRFESADGRLSAAYAAEDGQTSRLPVQFAVGSGTHATTFLTLIEGTGGEPTVLEHRLSVFSGETGVGLTPSHKGEPLERPLDCLGRVRRGDHAIRCIACHSTTGRIQGTTINDLRANVNCERCHGPGRRHVQAVETGASDLSIRFQPGAVSAREEIMLCGQCHRVPESLSGLPDPDDPKLARFQPVGLMQSACYRKSNGELRCSTCHDPHAAPQRMKGTANLRCAECHTATNGRSRTNCSVAPAGDCVACHMPAVPVHPGQYFHDHWIRKRDSSTPQP